MRKTCGAIPLLLYIIFTGDIKLFVNEKSHVSILKESKF